MGMPFQNLVLPEQSVRYQNSAFFLHFIKQVAEASSTLRTGILEFSECLRAHFQQSTKHISSIESFPFQLSFFVELVWKRYAYSEHLVVHRTNCFHKDFRSGF
jgi:hypothetical protein